MNIFSNIFLWTTLEDSWKSRESIKIIKKVIFFRELKPKENANMMLDNNKKEILIFLLWICTVKILNLCMNRKIKTLLTLTLLKFCKDSFFIHILYIKLVSNYSKNSFKKFLIDTQNKTRVTPCVQVKSLHFSVTVHYNLTLVNRLNQWVYMPAPVTL